MWILWWSTFLRLNTLVLRRKGFWWLAGRLVSLANECSSQCLNWYPWSIRPSLNWSSLTTWAKLLGLMVNCYHMLLLPTMFFSSEKSYNNAWHSSLSLLLSNLVGNKGVHDFIFNGSIYHFSLYQLTTFFLFMILLIICRLCFSQSCILLKLVSWLSVLLIMLFTRLVLFSISVVYEMCDPSPSKFILTICWQLSLAK